MLTSEIGGRRGGSVTAVTSLAAHVQIDAAIDVQFALDSDASIRRDGCAVARSAAVMLGVRWGRRSAVAALAAGLAPIDARPVGRRIETAG